MGTAAATATAVIGIDVSKATFDACLLAPDGKAREKAFPNTPAGFAALLAWADGHGAGVTARVGMEATGGYEDALARHPTPPVGSSASSTRPGSSTPG